MIQRELRSYIREIKSVIGDRDTIYLDEIYSNKIRTILAQLEEHFGGVLKYRDAKMIKCTICKIGNECYRILVNDIRCRKLDTACISDIDILFDSMEEIKDILEKEYGANVVFETTEWSN